MTSPITPLAVPDPLPLLEAGIRDVLDRMPGVAYVEADGPECTTCFMSSRIESLTGYPPERFLGPAEFWFELVHPDDLPGVRAAELEATATHEPYLQEYRLRTADGGEVWIRDQAIFAPAENGRPARWMGLLVDITKEKRLESDLRAEAVKFRSLAERIPAVVYIEGEGGSDDAPYYMGPRYEELFGYTPEERQANPKLWIELLHPEDRDRVVEAAKRSYDEGSFSQDYRMIARDGHVVWVHDETVLVSDEDGTPLFWQGVLYDISEQKRAEHGLAQALDMERDAVERLREADDLKNAFLTAVSHDLRTPLSAILGSAITLENADELGVPQEDRRQLIRSLARKAKRLTAMVTDLLDMDRLTRGLVQPRREHVDIGALLGRTVAESDVHEERTVHVQAEPIDAWIDESMVVRIVENLLVNATKHTPPTATIWVGAERAENGVILKVEDDGPGVPLDERERLFEPFERGHRSEPSPGLGVGLSLVARFAEAHGGRAWVDDRPGGGASFRVLLPDPATRLP